MSTMSSFRISSSSAETCGRCRHQLSRGRAGPNTRSRVQDRAVLQDPMARPEGVNGTALTTHGTSCPHRICGRPRIDPSTEESSIRDNPPISAESWEPHPLRHRPPAARPEAPGDSSSGDSPEELEPSLASRRGVGVGRGAQPSSSSAPSARSQARRVPSPRRSSRDRLTHTGLSRSPLPPKRRAIFEQHCFFARAALTRCSSTPRPSAQLTSGVSRGSPGKRISRSYSRSHARRSRRMGAKPRAASPPVGSLSPLPPRAARSEQTRRQRRSRSLASSNRRSPSMCGSAAPRACASYALHRPITRVSSLSSRFRVRGVRRHARRLPRRCCMRSRLPRDPRRSTSPWLRRPAPHRRGRRGCSRRSSLPLRSARQPREERHRARRRRRPRVRLLGQPLDATAPTTPGSLSVTDANDELDHRRMGQPRATTPASSPMTSRTARWLPAARRRPRSR